MAQTFPRHGSTCVHPKHAGSHERRRGHKGQCQSEPWDLSVHSPAVSEDVSQEIEGNDSVGMDASANKQTLNSFE